ncbi:hypothetical protein Afil01_62220 [Actinorhabdospora filicis]|uniref:Uncharacterized protein n=1 Tax=Actinorhabdospora filicis TaxID=1785913 RepID=A0A9W6SR45_9ACTN|nr:hypothetical protein [Actinorhabdospora filicis]GLZ81415.1 hypothetical protein Afil01_62220 [Actinorhabdospora filicis]
MPVPDTATRMRLSLADAATETSATIRADLSAGRIDITLDLPGATQDACVAHVRAIAETTLALLRDQNPGTTITTGGAIEGVLPGDPWTT